MVYDMIDTNTHIYASEDTEAIIDLGWGGLKDYIFPCLTSTGGICQIGEGLAHGSFLDLHILFHIRIDSGDVRGVKIIWIGQTLLEEWGISLQTLEGQAVKNLIKDRYTIQPIDDILNSFLDGDTVPGIPSECPLVYVLTNQRAFFGAAGILDKSIVSAFADTVGHDIFILPSSRHEVLLCPDNGEVTAGELSGLVKEVNDSVVEPCDRLSDHVYYYDREMDEIRIGR